MTDEKGQLSPRQYAVLLVDTGEMGGRCVLDRLRYLMIRSGLSVNMCLRVHDLDGFASDQDLGKDFGGGSRREDRRDREGRRRGEHFDAPSSTSDEDWHESRACDRWHRRRLDVRPGMTCYWQVNKAQAKSFDDWMRLDLKYVDQFSLLSDFGLIAKTLTMPITGRGSE